MKSEKPYEEFYGGPVKECPLEDTEQIKSANIMRHHYPEVLAFHPVNESGASGTSQFGAKLRRKGRLTGVPDWVIAHRSFTGKYPGAYVEMKRIGKSQSTPVSDEQLKCLRMASEEGYYTAVCYGAEQFRICIKRYLTEL